MRRTLLVLVGCLCLLMATGPQAFAASRVHDGVGRGGGASLRHARVGPAIPDDINFDNLSAPCLYASATQLKSLDGAHFKGHGAVLNECSHFNVTGYSPPNFLAFNCAAQLPTGQVPQLPETIKLPISFGDVSLSVGSAGSAGTILKIQGKGSEGSETHLVTLGAAMQTVSFTKPIQTIKLKSADRHNPVCQLVVDDIVYG